MRLWNVMKKRLFVSYLLSFLSLVLLPLAVISILVSSSFHNSARQQYLELQKLMLRSAFEQLDSYAKLPVETSSKLVQLKGYKRLLAGTAFTAYERQDSVAEVSQYLNGLIRNDICTDYCIYFPESDLTVTSSGSTSSFLNFYEMALDYEGVAGEAFWQNVCSVDLYQCSGRLVDASGQEYFCTVQALPSAYLNRSSYLLSFFSIGRFQYELRQHLPLMGYFYIDTVDGKMIATNLPTLQNADETVLDIDGDRYLRFCETSEATQMRYTFYIPESTVFESLFRYQRMFWLVFSLVLLASVLMAFLLALRRYAPIQRLFCQAFPNRAPEQQEDFDLMSRYLTEVNRQGQYYAGEIRSQWLELRNQVLIQILISSDFDEEKVSMLLQQYQLEFPNPQFCVILVGGCSADRLQFENTTLCSFPINDYFALIINDSPENPILEKVSQALIERQASLPGMQVRASSMGSSLHDLHRCFLEALNQMDPKSAAQGVEDPPNLPDLCTAEQEVSILNALYQGDYPACEQLLGELYEKCAEAPEQLTMQLFHGLTAMACHVYLGMNSAERGPLEQLESVLSCAVPDRHCFHAILKLYRSVSELCSQPQKGRREQIVNAVIQHIHQHYNDPNLSLHAVADAFHVSYYYLSHIFNDEMRQSFTKLLNLCRVEHAKQLLEDTKLTAQDIASAVGYTNSSTFFRVFRKITGVTPNEYRMRQLE